MSNTIFNINSNKCGCTVQSYTEIKPCLSKNDECCLILCNILTGKDIYPCGIGNTSGNLDITSYIKIPKCCDETTILTNIPYHSNNFIRFGDYIHAFKTLLSAYFTTTQTGSTSKYQWFSS